MYKDLKIWQDSVILLKKIYVLAEQFPKSEEYKSTTRKENL